MESIKNAGERRVKMYHDWLTFVQVPQGIYDELREIAHRIDPTQADATHNRYLMGCFGIKAACDMYCVIINDYAEKHSRKLD